MKEGQDSQIQRCDSREEAGVMGPLALKVKGSQEPRHVGSLSKLRKEVVYSPLGLWKGHSTAEILTIGLQDPV